MSQVIFGEIELDAITPMEDGVRHPSTISISADILGRPPDHAGALPREIFHALGKADKVLRVLKFMLAHEARMLTMRYRPVDGGL